jgi:hypothetical protein
LKREDAVNQALKALVAVACVAIIAAAGVYLNDRRAVRAAAAIEAEHAQRMENMMYLARVEAERAAREAEQAMVVEACRRDLDAFDNHQATLAFVQRVEASGQPLTGDTMAAEIQSCRNLVTD